MLTPELYWTSKASPESHTHTHPACARIPHVSIHHFQQVAGPNGQDFEYSTKLFYMVHIRPKGPVPVMALEWQISNEVPNNLAALKKAAEAVTPDYVEVSGALSWQLFQW